MSADFPDLAVWGGISLVPATLSFFGWLGRRKERRRFKVEREQQAARDAHPVVAPIRQAHDFAATVGRRWLLHSQRHLEFIVEADRGEHDRK